MEPDNRIKIKEWLTLDTQGHAPSEILRAFGPRFPSGPATSSTASLLSPDTTGKKKTKTNNNSGDLSENQFCAL